jgi:hypothetical protein
MTKKTFRSPISEEFVSLIFQHPPQWRIETPTEIAKRAVKDGIHANEALQKISGRWGASDTTLALTLFIESLCNKNSALILEYTIFPVLLTTRTGNPNTVRRLSVISADKSFADALRILFENGVDVGVCRKSACGFLIWLHCLCSADGSLSCWDDGFLVFGIGEIDAAITWLKSNGFKTDNEIIAELQWVK